MKDDQRIVLTKRLLKEALINLLKKKDLAKINVTELCQQAGINRTTFYRHYEQPRDILSEMRWDISSDIKAFAKKDYLEGGIKSWLIDTCQYFYEHAEILNILFKSRSDEEFVSLLNDLCNEQFPKLRSSGYATEVDDETLKLGAYYFAGGIFYVIRQWLSEPIEKTPLEVAELIYHFVNIE